MAFSLAILFLSILLTKFFKNNFILDFKKLSVLKPYLCILIFPLLIAVSYFAFDNSAFLIDGMVQLFQAKLLQEGAFGATSHQSEFFLILNTFLNDGQIFSQYPPLHSLLLTFGVFLEMPWAMPVIISGLAYYFSYKFFENILEELEAALASLILLICPFFLFVGSSFLNHSTSFLLVAACFYFLSEYEKENKAQYLLFASLLIGFGLAVRPLTMIALSGVYFLFLSKTLFQQPKHIALILIAILPGLSLYLFYNQQTTGDPFITGYQALWGEAHGLGFHQSPYGKDYNLIAAFSDLFSQAKLLNSFAFQDFLPILLFIPFVLLKAKFSDIKLLIILLALPFTYFFYWHFDQVLGPRYWFESLIVLIPLFVRAIFIIYDKLNLKLQSVLVYFIFFSLFFSLILGVTGKTIFYYQQVRPDNPKLLLKQLTKNQKNLVFIPVSWAGRSIAKLRAKGVEASLIERSYRFISTCELHDLSNKLYNQTISLEQAKEQLTRKISMKRQPKRLKDEKGIKLQIYKNESLSEECQNELQHDKLGISSFAPFAWLNNSKFDADLIVARDLTDLNSKLIIKHPEHKVYIYRNGKLENV